MAVLRGSLKISSLSETGKEIFLTYDLSRRRDLRRNRRARWRRAERGRDRNDRLRALGLTPAGSSAGAREPGGPLHDPAQNTVPQTAADDRTGRGCHVPATRV